MNNREKYFDLKHLEASALSISDPESKEFNERTKLDDQIAQILTVIRLDQVLLLEGEDIPEEELKELRERLKSLVK